LLPTTGAHAASQSGNLFFSLMSRVDIAAISGAPHMGTVSILQFNYSGSASVPPGAGPEAT